MGTYNVSSSKRKRALKQLIKENTKELKGFPKFCYGLTWFLRILAVVLGLLNIVYVILNNEPLDLLFLIMTFGFPYGFSFMSAAVYKVVCCTEYHFRRKECIMLVNGGVIYSYHDDRAGFDDTIFAFNISYDKIQHYDYNEKTQCITLYGDILGDTYENGELKSSEEFSQISLFNAFDIDLKELLDKNCLHNNKCN